MIDDYIVAKNALDEYFQKKQEIRSTIEKILSSLEQDNRIKIIYEATIIFELQIKALVSNFPEKGYEQWNGSQAVYWDEAINRLNEYYRYKK